MVAMALAATRARKALRGSSVGRISSIQSRTDSASSSVRDG
jgi:hypothetical protein